MLLFGPPLFQTLDPALGGQGFFWLLQRCGQIFFYLLYVALKFRWYIGPGSDIPQLWKNKPLLYHHFARDIIFLLILLAGKEYSTISLIEGSSNISHSYFGTNLTYHILVHAGYLNPKSDRKIFEWNFNENIIINLYKGGQAFLTWPTGEGFRHFIHCWLL